MKIKYFIILIFLIASCFDEEGFLNSKLNSIETLGKNLSDIQIFKIRSNDEYIVESIDKPSNYAVVNVKGCPTVVFSRGMDIDSFTVSLISRIGFHYLKFEGGKKTIQFKQKNGNYVLVNNRLLENVPRNKKIRYKKLQDEWYFLFEKRN